MDSDLHPATGSGRARRAEAREASLPDAARRVFDGLLGGRDPSAAERLQEGERRYVTVLFADIFGFTALSEAIGDPEDLRDLINACLQRLADCVYRYGGTIDKYIGDCVMAVFGAPVAQEDDAERAVLAALDMTTTLQRFASQRRVDLQLHVGINTGEVVAGAVGTARDAAYTVLGDAVNVASRLEGAAGKGDILVAETTYRLTRHAVDYAPQPPLTVKGKSAPLTCYLARRRRAARGSLRGFGDRETPLVGRGAELRTTLAALERLRRGQGGLLELSGEAGTGKSRLATELKRAAALPPFQPGHRPVDWIEGRCLSFGEHIPFWLPLELLRCWLRIEPGDPESLVASKLEQGVRTCFGQDQQASDQGQGSRPEAAEGQEEGETMSPATAPSAPASRALGARPALAPLPPLRPAAASTPLPPLRPIVAPTPLPRPAAPPGGLAPRPLPPTARSTQPGARSTGAPAATSATVQLPGPSPQPPARPERVPSPQLGPRGSPAPGQRSALDGDTVLALLRALFSLPPQHRFVEALEPQVRQRLTIRALVELLRRRAEQQPLLLIADDLHWTDPASLAFLDALVPVAVSTPVLLVAIARPDFQHTWPDALPRERRARLELRPLAADQTESLVRTLLGERPVAPDLVRRLVERAAGNPFFLEELVKSVLEHDADAARTAEDSSAAGRPVLAIDVEVPQTVHAVLMARIDRLEEGARHVLQAASAIGREFLYRVLAWLAEVDAELEREIEARLAQLQTRRLIQPEADAVERAYAFHHPLTQEVAYSTLLRRRRRRYHRYVAEALETLFPSRRDELLEVIAHHYYLSQDWPRAQLACLQAGAKAAAQYANQEALAHFDRAAECGRALLDRLAAAEDGADEGPWTSAEVAGRTSAALEGTGDVHQIVGHIGAARDCFARALALLDHAGNRTDGRPVLHARVELDRKLARLDELQGNWEGAVNWWRRGLADAQLAMEVAQAASASEAGGAAVPGGPGDGSEDRPQPPGGARSPRPPGRGAVAAPAQPPPLELARLYFDAAAGYYRRGDLPTAQEWCGQGLSILESYDAAAAWRDAVRGHNVQAAVLARLGNASLAEQHYLYAQALAEQCEDAAGTAATCNNLGTLLVEMSRWAEARALYERALELGERLGDRKGTGGALINLGEVERRLGRLPEADSRCAEAAAVFEELGFPHGLTLAISNRGLVALAADDWERARTLLQDALERRQALELRDFLPENLRALAEAYLGLGDLATAQQRAQEAVALAQALAQPRDEGLACLTVARVLAVATGEAAEATDAAAAAEEWFARAREVLEASGSAYDLALVDLWSGFCRLRSPGAGARAVAGARQQVAAAATVFASLGAVRDLERAQAVLQACRE